MQNDGATSSSVEDSERRQWGHVMIIDLVNFRKLNRGRKKPHQPVWEFSLMRPRRVKPDYIPWVIVHEQQVTRNKRVPTTLTAKSLLR
jgi:hypothetical protein